MLIFCANLTFMLPQLSIHQHVTGAWVREMFRNVKSSICSLRSPVPWTNSPTLAQPTVTLQQEHLSLPTRRRLFTQALLEDASTAQVSIPPASPSSFLLTFGSYSRGFLKKAWNLPSNFPNLEKVCNIDISSGQEKLFLFFVCFVCLFVCLFLFVFFFSQLQEVPYNWIFFVGQIFSNLARMFAAHYESFFKIPIDHLFDNFESGKKTLFGKKSGKSRIFDPKTCANPVNRTNSQRDLYSKTSLNSHQMRQAFFFKFEADLSTIECTILIDSCFG